mmetsp:Transcript_26979/g.88216  ORF Transcript_26979/g.88216 Transcript_26979/m.88216 type:complete len:266 (+) Transcript_26979:113-910(+)
MRVHHHRQLLHGGSGSDGVGALLDEVGRVDADDVNSQHLAGILVEQALGHARSLELSQGLGVGAEAAGRLAESEALSLSLLLRLLLGEADHGDLRVGEASGGDGVVVDCVRMPADVLDGRDSLSRRSMCQHHLAIGIADAVEVGDDASSLLVQHLHLLVHLHKPANCLDPHVLKPQGLRVGDTTCAHESSVHVERRVGNLLLGLSVHELDLDRLLARLARHNLGSKDAGVAVDLARLNQHAVSDASDLRVEGGHESVHGLDESDF